MPSYDGRHFGWIKDRKDTRDFAFRAKFREMELPASYSVRPMVDWVYDQGNLGSCTANGIASAFRLEQKKQGLPAIDPARLFIYYNERDMEGTVGEDAGAMIRDGIKSINAQGVCDDPVWPYIISRFADRPKPEAYEAAQAHQSLEYARVDPTDITAVKSAIYEGGGRLIPFGVPLYKSWQVRGWSADIPDRQWTDWRNIGGHCMDLGGWDDSRQRFDVLNSWGEDVGKGGWFTISYAYIRKRGSDLWVIRRVEA